MKKRVISILMVLVICVSSHPWTVYAALRDNNLEYEMMRQERIDEVMEELNELVAIDLLEEKLAEEMEYKDDGLNGLKGNGKSNERLKEESRETKRKECEKELESLGVKKIDPNNPEDIKLLEDMQQNMSEQNGTVYSVARTSVYDSAPDFAMLANVYSIYLMDGKYRHNGVWYNYRYIQVIDDKGYNGLFYNQDNDLTANIAQSAVSSVLKYNFEYLMDSLFGLISLGNAALEWTLGNVFAALDGIDAAKITRSSKNNLYEVTHASVTEMRYCFFYNGGWNHIGTSGTATVVRRDSFVGNVDGKPEIEDSKTSFTISSKWTLLDFITSYVQVMETRPNFCVIDDFGSIIIKGFNGQKFYFKPVFAAEPIELI